MPCTVSFTDTPHSLLRDPFQLTRTDISVGYDDSNEEWSFSNIVLNVEHEKGASMTVYVFFGTLSIGNTEHDVACKFSFDHGEWNIEEEGKLYAGPLAKLHGIYVPKVFGLFKGHVTERRYPAACIFLERGDQTDDTKPMFKYSEKFR